MLFQKRLFDLSVTILSAIVWIPVFFIASFINLVVEGRPVLYISERRTGVKVQKVPKFRTMVKDAEKVYNRANVEITDKNVRFLNTGLDSPLYTTVGRFIEKISLTEIPQLFLVLKGDMSLVGNRPLPVNVITSIKENFHCVEERFKCTSGLTGAPQLIGREMLKDQDRLALEITYCRMVSQAYSVKTDFLILLYTVMVSLKLRSFFTIDEVLDLLTSNHTNGVLYPEGLRRRSRDDGMKRDILFKSSRKIKDGLNN